MTPTNPTSNGQQATKHWIFQANPNKYRIHEALLTCDTDHWNLNQHAQDVAVGDRILIWISGDEAGIYALGTVMTMPVVMPDAPTGMLYWSTAADGIKLRPRVLVRYDQKWLDTPLTKAFLLTDPVLCGLQIIRQPRATNFRVTVQQWEALQQWLDLDAG